MKYLLDTCSLLDDPNLAETYTHDGHQAIVHPSVLYELDKHKTAPGLLGLSARQAIKSLDSMVDQILFPDVPSSQYADPDLLAYMAQDDVTLVTRDSGLALQAKARYGRERVVESEAVKIQTESLFNAVSTLPPDAFVEWDRNKGMLKDGIAEEYNLSPNQYLTLDNMLGQYNDGAVHRINIPQNGYGIVGLNAEQKQLMHMLYDDRFDLSAAVGIAGCGKTLLTLAAGIDQVRAKEYEKVIVFRPLVHSGKDPGTLPGGLMDKVGDYFKPIHDNLEFIFQNQRKKLSQTVNTQDAQMLMQEGKLELDIMAKVRGRTFRDSFVILDEAQNLTPQQMKTLITRIGSNSRLVLTGDPYQVDLPGVNQHNNGLTHVVKRFIGQDNFAYVELKHSKRSRLAEQAANLL